MLITGASASRSQSLSTIPDFSIDLTAFGPVPAVQVPLDSRLIHRIKVRFTGTTTEALGLRVDMRVYASTSTSTEPVQLLPAYPQPAYLFLSSGEEQIVAIMLDEAWGEITRNPSFPPGTFTRKVRFEFEATVGGTRHRTTETVTYTITTLDGTQPITGSYQVQGRVVDSEGAAIAGANVSLGTELVGQVETSLARSTQFAYLDNAGTRIVAAARDVTPGSVGISFLRVERQSR